MKYLVFDAYNILFRSFHAIKGLKTSQDLAVNGIFGFVRNILETSKKMSPAEVIVVFDSGGKTWKHKKHSDYKANRGEVAPDLIPQFAIAREFVGEFNFPNFEDENQEADDIIASVAHNLKPKGEVFIISSDKDFIQLIPDGVKIYNPWEKTEITEEYVKKKYDIWPNQFLEYLILVGDSADGVSGITGIGPKTASKLLNEIGNLEKIIFYAENGILKPESKNKIFIEEKYKIQKNKELIQLNKNLDINCSQIYENKNSESPLNLKKKKDFLEKYEIKLQIF